MSLDAGMVTGNAMQIRSPPPPQRASKNRRAPKTIEKEWVNRQSRRGVRTRRLQTQAARAGHCELELPSGANGPVTVETLSVRRASFLRLKFTGVPRRGFETDAKQVRSVEPASQPVPDISQPIPMSAA